jgi:hypothetical protein
MGGWLTPRLGRFTLGNNSVPIVQEDEWAPRPCYMDGVDIATTGIRIPDRPARSEYRVCYPGPYLLVVNCNIVCLFTR